MSAVLAPRPLAAMKRALLMLAALPFVILGGIAVLVGCPMFLAGCMLWPPPRRTFEDGFRDFLASHPLPDPPPRPAPSNYRTKES